MIRLFVGSTDRTSDLKRALEDEFSISVSASLDSFEVRSEKPLSRLWFEVSSDHAATGVTVEIFNGSTWTACTSVVDDTSILKAPGFLSWVNPTISDAFLSGGFYRYRFTLNALPASGDSDPSLVFLYVGILFCDDSDLRREFSNVDDYKPEGDETHIRARIAAKDDIVQNYRNRGVVVFGVQPRDLTEFDFLNPDQFRMAATYKSLEKTFGWRSDAVDDKNEKRADKFAKNFGDAINLLFSSIDIDGDGEDDSATGGDMRVNTGEFLRV